MLSAISCGSKTRFQSSRISTGLPNSIALLQASEKTPSTLVEDDGAEDVHVAEQEIARRTRGRRRALDHFVHRLAHDDQQRGADRLRQARLQQAICSTVTRCGRMTGA